MAKQAGLNPIFPLWCVCFPVSSLFAFWLKGKSVALSGAVLISFSRWEKIHSWMAGLYFKESSFIQWARPTHPCKMNICKILTSTWSTNKIGYRPKITWRWSHYVNMKSGTKYEKNSKRWPSSYDLIKLELQYLHKYGESINVVISLSKPTQSAKKLESIYALKSWLRQNLLTLQLGTWLQLHLMSVCGNMW